MVPTPAIIRPATTSPFDQRHLGVIIIPPLLASLLDERVADKISSLIRLLSRVSTWKKRATGLAGSTFSISYLYFFSRASRLSSMANDRSTT